MTFTDCSSDVLTKCISSSISSKAIVNDSILFSNSAEYSFVISVRLSIETKKQLDNEDAFREGLRNVDRKIMRYNSKTY